MEENKHIKSLPAELKTAVENIKEAILRGQYEAAKGVNRVQLAVYFGIGKYISRHSRGGKWGTNALESISDQLHRELPGLRGYSASALKNMRKFYENWQMLDAPSSVENDMNSNSTIAIAELSEDAPIDVTHAIQIPNITDFPVEDFFRLPFTHHVYSDESVCQ